MATYKEIKGITIQTKTSDPVQNVGSWSSGPAINTARFQTPGAGATQNASYIVGGAIPPASPNLSALHEQFDGSSWTEASDLGTAGYALGTFGTPSAAIAAAGYRGSYSTATEVWNGSSWTSGTASNTPRGYLGASGTTTDGLIYGGLPVTGNTEKYNGSSWTETGNLNTARRAGGQSNLGSGSAAIYSGGQPPIMANVEQFNGSSWSETSDLNTAREHQWGFGTSTAQIVCGGSTPPYTAKTESWNGSTWTEVNDLGTASLANAGSGGGTSTSGIIAAQYTGSLTTLSEQWDFPPVTADILTEGDLFLSGGTTLKGFGKAGGIPAATFSSGGSLNTSRGYMAGCGTQTAGSVFGGSPYNPPTNKSQLHEQYDGSSWTETTDTNTGHSAGSASTKGTQTAVIVFSGGNPPTGNYTESWNGSTWTEVNNLNTSRNNGPAGFGVQTSAICCGGNNPPLTTTESWDGTSWTAVNSMNGGRRNFSGCGPSTAGIVAGGQGPGGTVNSSETWDGTSWTETNNLNSSRRGVMLFGNGSPDAFCTGGGGSANNEFWNGTSWTELNNLSTARNDGGAAGSTVAGFVAGGPQSGGDATEEWTADNVLSNVTLS